MGWPLILNDLASQPNAFYTLIADGWIDCCNNNYIYLTQRLQTIAPIERVILYCFLKYSFFANLPGHRLGYCIDLPVSRISTFSVDWRWIDVRQGRI